MDNLEKNLKFSESKSKTINMTDSAIEEERIKLSQQLTEKIQEIEAERQQEKANINEAIKTAYISALASQFNISKPEYTRFFKGDIQVENGKVLNSDNVVQQFTEFRNKSPELFNIPANERTPIPKTDTFYQRSKIDIPGEISREEQLLSAIKCDMRTNKSYQNISTAI